MAQSDLEAGTGPKNTSQTVSSSRAGNVQPQESGKISPRQIRYLLGQTTRKVSQKMVQRFQKKAEQDLQDQTHAVGLTHFSPNDQPHVLDTTKDGNQTSASLLIDDASGNSRSSVVNLNDTGLNSKIDTRADSQGRGSEQQQAPQAQVQEWSKFDALPSGYTQRIGQMTEAEIDAEKEDRKKIRCKWRQIEEYGYLEDP
ncbi:hypothetical protein Q9189_001336 [Teloschistes chrysophthalmus]